MSVSAAIAVLPTTFNALRLSIVDDRFEVGRWTEVRSSPGSCKHKLRTPDVVCQKRFLLGTDLKKLLNNDSAYDDITQFVMVVTTTASRNKTPDVDSQSIQPAATVSYTVHVPRRAEEVDEAMPSFENEEKRHVSDCFKFIKPSSPLSLSCLSLMLLPSSPPPSTLSAFVGLLKFVVGRLLSYWDPYVIGQKRFLLGTDLKNASTTTRLMTANNNKTPDVDSQSILPAATVSYTVHVPKRAEEVDEAMPSFENEEKRHTASSNKTPDVDSQSILPEATVSYTVMCPREPKKLMKQCQALKTNKRGT
ncbi:hypothetical protein DY000_02023655 [Brassica cretica]|uniref:Uncharacterized protein n=1 Tax=Brassica cretica TaxID=69181 RepID=A0ABQ7E8E8_BRACR|nr:hypothetical protein DY000_02023655 [Brassica cretica]